MQRTAASARPSCRLTEEVGRCIQLCLKLLSSKRIKTFLPEMLGNLALVEDTMLFF